VFRDIIRMMHTTNSLEEVLNLGVRRTSKTLHAKGALVRLLNKETQQLEVRAAWGMDKCYLSKGQVSSDKLLTWDNDGKKIHIITDILNAPQVAYPQHAWDHGIRMMLDIPLTVSSQVIGLMRIYLTEPRQFSDDELGVWPPGLPMKSTIPWPVSCFTAPILSKESRRKVLWKKGSRLS